MAGYSFQFLGSPRILRDGNELKITRRKSIALLAYLAASDGKQSRGRIVGLLWPKANEQRGRASLRTALSAVNAELNRKVLAPDGEFVVLDPSLLIDVKEFRTKAAHIDAKEMFDAGALQALQEAVDMYAGPFLDGFDIGSGHPEFEDWQFNQEQNLRLICVRALERLVQAETLASSFDAAIHHAEQWVAHVPEHEHAHRRLIELYAWTGRRAEALHQYDICVSYLDRELAVEPEESTVRLYESVRDNKLSVPASMRERIKTPTNPVAGSSVYHSTILSIGLIDASEKLMQQRPYDAASVVDILIHRSLDEALEKQSADSVLCIGDALVALFGRPSADNDDAYRAVIASVEAVQICAHFGISITAGIATGLVYSQPHEASKRSVSLIGPAVTQANLLRLFGHPGTILVEDATHSRTKDAVAYEPIPRGLSGMGRRYDTYRVLLGQSAATRLL